MGWPYTFPIRTRIKTIIKINPSAPLGRYPQPLLYGHLGTDPKTSRIRTIRSIVPIPHYLLY